MARGSATADSQRDPAIHAALVALEPANWAFLALASVEAYSFLLLALPILGITAEDRG